MNFRAFTGASPSQPKRSGYVMHSLLLRARMGGGALTRWRFALVWQAGRALAGASGSYGARGAHSLALRARMARGALTRWRFGLVWITLGREAGRHHEHQLRIQHASGMARLFA